MELENITPDNLPLDFVKQYLRVEHNFDDLEIQLMVKSAQHYVRNYINQPDGTDMDIELVIPILTLVAYFYENKTVTMKSTEKLDVIFGSVLNLHRGDLL